LLDSLLQEISLKHNSLDILDFYTKYIYIFP